MQLQASEENGYRIIQIDTPKIDDSNANQFRRELHRLSDNFQSKIILDLSNVQVITSSALGVLIAFFKNMVHHQQEFNVIAATRHVLDTFRLIGFDKVFSIFQSLDACFTQKTAPPQQQISIDVSAHGVYQVLKIDASYLEYRNNNAVKAQLDELMEKGYRHLVMDMTAIPILDSDSLSGLISLLKHINSAQGSLRIVAPYPEVLSVLRITSLDQLVPIFHTLDAALS